MRKNIRKDPLDISAVSHIRESAVLYVREEKTGYKEEYEKGIPYIAVEIHAFYSVS